MNISQKIHVLKKHFFDISKHSKGFRNSRNLEEMFSKLYDMHNDTCIMIHAKKAKPCTMGRVK